MEIFWAIFSGVLIFVLGQFLLKFLLDPIQEFKKVVAEISHALMEYAPTYSNPGLTGLEREKEASAVFKILSAKINTAMYMIPFYPTVSKVLKLPSRVEISEIMSCLIGLSNSLHQGMKNHADENMKRDQRIQKRLRIFIPKNMRITDEDDKIKFID